jgi:ABC-type nitrate/sulfonate/bicarbonate transport system substrate-binding protein
MFRSRTRILAPPLVIAMVALSGCGGIAASAGSTSPNGLQKTTLNVAVVPAVDSAGFFVALHEGLFKKQGLTINYTPAVSSDEVIDQQVDGQYDITGGNYVSYIQHYVDNHQPLEIIAEGSVMQQGTQAIYTMPDSKIKTLAELKGHLLGINAPLNINYLLAASVLTENGIKLNEVRFPTAPIPFPNMAADLAAGRLDAIALPEPFATAAEQQYGVVPLADLNQGATELRRHQILGRAEPRHPAGVRRRAHAGPGDRRHQPVRGGTGHGVAGRGPGGTDRPDRRLGDGGQHLPHRHRQGPDPARRRRDVPVRPAEFPVQRHPDDRPLTPPRKPAQPGSRRRTAGGSLVGAPRRPRRDITGGRALLPVE